MKIPRAIALIAMAFTGLALQGCSSTAGAAPHGAGAALIAPRTALEPVVQLAQSVPSGTGLEQTDLPFAKDVWIDLARGAESTIDMGQFYLANQPGQALEPVIQELEKAGARGVRIRMLISKVMIQNDLPTYRRVLAIPHAQVQVWDLAQLTGGIIHAKYWVVDQKEVYVGSQNFDWRSLTQIHETGVRVRDPEVAGQLTQIFNTDWKIATTGLAPTALPDVPSPRPPKAMELVASPQAFNPAGVRAALPALLELLGAAKHSIRFQVMTYSTVEGHDFWPPIDNALRAAAVRGVQVQMMVADWNTGKPDIDHLKSLGLIPGVQLKIASIPQEPNVPFIPYARVIHSKILMIDDQILWVGTSNWGKDYFESSRNVELIFRSPDLAAQGNRIFTKLWQSPYVAFIDPTHTYVPPKTDSAPDPAAVMPPAPSRADSRN